VFGRAVPGRPTWVTLAFVCVCVRAPHSGRELALAMVAAALRPLRDEAINLVLAEADADDVQAWVVLGGSQRGAPAARSNSYGRIRPESTCLR
jgi:hypothetical protein